MKDSLIINPEKVGIQARLQQPRQHHNQLQPITMIPAINPVQQVKHTVHAQAQQIMRSD